MKKTLAMIAITTSLCGCVTQQPPPQEQITSASYGERPANYQEKIKNYFSTMLKDPSTTQYSFLPIFKGYSQDGPWAPSGGKVYFGWVAPVIINVKNDDGKYTGNQKFVFILSDGTLYDVTGNSLFNRVKPVN